MKKTVKLVSSLALAAVMAFSSATALGAQAKMYKNKETGGYYYVNDKTGKRESGMKKIGKYYYYFDENGDAVSGFVKYKGSWYYFDSSNKYRMKTGWFDIAALGESQKYYFGKDGKMRVGKHTINGKKYDFSIAGGLKGKNSVDIKDAHDLEKDFFDLSGVLEQYYDLEQYEEGKEGFLNYLNEHYKGYDSWLPDSTVSEPDFNIVITSDDFPINSNTPMRDAMFQTYNGTDFYLMQVHYYYGYGQELIYDIPDSKKDSGENIYKYIRKLLKENGFSDKNVKSETKKTEEYAGPDKGYMDAISVEYSGFTNGSYKAVIEYSYFKGEYPSSVRVYMYKYK